MTPLPDAPPPERLQWLLFGGFYGAMAGGALLWMGLRGDDLATRMTADGVGPAAGVAAGASVALAVVGASDLFLEDQEWTRRLKTDIALLLSPLHRGKAVAVALLSGLAEELLFRGALQPAIGFLPAALLFGVVHGGFHRELFGWAVFATAMGAVLGALFWWSGGLLAPATAHALINGIQLWRLARPARSSRLMGTPGSDMP